MTFCPLFCIIALSTTVGTGCSRPDHDEAANHALDHDEDHHAPSPETTNFSDDSSAGVGVEDYSDMSLENLFQDGMAKKQRELEESAQQMDDTRKHLEQTGAEGLKGMDNYSKVVHTTDAEMTAFNRTLDVLEATRQAQYRQMEPDRMSSLDSLHAVLGVSDSAQPHTPEKAANAARAKLKAAREQLELAEGELALLPSAHNANAIPQVIDANLEASRQSVDAVKEDLVHAEDNAAKATEALKEAEDEEEEEDPAEGQAAEQSVEGEELQWTPHDEPDDDY